MAHGWAEAKFFGEKSEQGTSLWFTNNVRYILFFREALGLASDRHLCVTFDLALLPHTRNPFTALSSL